MATLEEGELGGERAPRPPWSEFQRALRSAGFHPSRRLGQNFLLDENNVRAIARDAGVGPGDLVLEVGAGCGFLSVHLAHAGARLVAVEIDARLVPIARAFLADYPEARVLEADVLASKSRLAPEVEALLPADGDWHLVANLPYSISGPLLATVAGREPPARTLTVLVQAEVAERMVAEPGSAAWGPLSVGLASAYRGTILRRLSPGLFWPRPKVESALVRLERREDRLPGAARARVVAFARRLLERRRQSLGRRIGELAGRERGLALLAELAIDPRRRAETLSLDELAELEARLGLPPG